MNERSRQNPTGEAEDVVRVFEVLERSISRRRRSPRPGRTS